jgi:hypothetical protein
MINIKQAAQELNNMLTEAVASKGVFVPIEQNVLQYKNYFVKRETDGSWTIIFVNGRGIRYTLANTFLKISAFSIAKLHEKRNAKAIDDIKNADKTFEINYTDSVYFKHTYKVTEDSVKKDTALWRYEIVSEKAKQAKQKIDNTFYRLIA